MHVYESTTSEPGVSLKHMKFDSRWFGNTALIKNYSCQWLPLTNWKIVIYLSLNLINSSSDLMLPPRDISLGHLELSSVIQESKSEIPHITIISLIRFAPHKSHWIPYCFKVNI